MRGLRGRTDTDVNLTSCDFVSDLSDGSQTGGALPVDGVDSGRVRDASCKGSHTSSSSASTRRKDITNRDVFDECRVEAGFGVCRSENFGKDLLWPCVLETTLSSLRRPISDSSPEKVAQITEMTDLCDR